MPTYKKLTAALASLAMLVATIGIMPSYASAAVGCSEDSFTLYSGNSVLADGDAAVATYVHPAWTASIPGATWIWDAALVADAEATTTVSFTQNFTVADELNSADLTLAADNSYVVYVNGDQVASSSAVTYNAAATIDLSAYVDEGSNTLRIDVTNDAGNVGDTGTDNPAGLLFSLEVDAGTCDGVEAGKAQITVIKTLVGGTATSSDFMINVTGTGVSTTSATSTSSFLTISGNASGTVLTLEPGTYNITEVASNGWNVAYSAGCSGTIDAGEDLTCTITNTAIVANNDDEDEEEDNDSGNTNGNNINVNVNPNIEVNPIFNNVSDRGFILPAGFFGLFDNGDFGSVLGATTSTLSCGPAARTVSTGQLVTFNATGGSGNYTWTAPGMTARTGNQLTVFYAAPGTSSVTVASGGQTATCNITIAGGSVLGANTNTPGLPNTGMGGSATLLLNMGVVLALSGITTMVIRKRALR